MSNNQVILLIIPSLQAGGMERVMAELATHFDKKEGVYVHIILYGIHRDIFYPIPDTITIHRPTFPFSNNFRFHSALRTMLFIRNRVKSLNPSTVLSFGEYWNSFVLLSLWGLRIPVFVSDRSQPDKSLGRFHNFLRKKLYPQARGVIAQTAKAKTIFEAQYENRNTTVIGNPIRSIPQAGATRENIVLMVGRFIRTKNQDKLIKMFASLSMPDWKLVLVGYDHLKQRNEAKLLQLIKDLKLEDRVIIVGKQTNVDKLYQTSKIFAFTSTSEGFPNVIGEAMSAGLPVVAFDCMAGPADMIEDGKSGYLISTHDYESFKKKLAVLMGNESLQKQFGEHGRHRIMQFSIENIGEQYLKFITKAVN